MGNATSFRILPQEIFSYISRKHSYDRSSYKFERPITNCILPKNANSEAATSKNQRFCLCDIDITISPLSSSCDAGQLIISLNYDLFNGV